MKDRWRNYPHAVLVSRQMEVYKRLIETLQAIESHTKQLAEERDMPKQEETPMNKNHEETLEKGSNKVEPSPQAGTHNIGQKEPKLIPNSNVPEVDEEWGTKLWDVVKYAQNEIAKSIHWLR